MSMYIRSNIVFQESLNYWRTNYQKYIIYNYQSQAFSCRAGFVNLPRPMRDHLIEYAKAYSEVDMVTLDVSKPIPEGKSFYVIPPSWIISAYK